MQYEDFILNADVEIVRTVQDYCAEIEQRPQGAGIDVAGRKWNKDDAHNIVQMLNTSANPVALFRFMDERTGSHYVGYRTQDGREWFHILRQMRNTRGSGLLENLGR